MKIKIQKWKMDQIQDEISGSETYLSMRDSYKKMNF